MKAIPKSTRIKVLAAVIAAVESPLLDMVETAEVLAFRRPAADGATVGDVLRAQAEALAADVRGGAPAGDRDVVGLAALRALAGAADADATRRVVQALSYLASATDALRATRHWDRAAQYAGSVVFHARRHVVVALQTAGVPDAEGVERATWNDALARAKKELSGG